MKTKRVVRHFKSKLSRQAGGLSFPISLHDCWFISTWSAPALFMRPASDSCEIEVFHLPRTSSRILNSSHPNTLILKGLRAALISEGPYERNIKDHHRWQTQIMKWGACVTWDSVIVYRIWVTPFMPYLGQNN